MKIVVTALIKSLEAILNCLIVITLIFIMFSILGTFFLKDKMGFCDVDDKYKYKNIKFMYYFIFYLKKVFQNNNV